MSKVTYEILAVIKLSPSIALVQVTEGDKCSFLELPTDEAKELVRRMSIPARCTYTEDPRGNYLLEIKSPRDATQVSYHKELSEVIHQLQGNWMGEFDVSCVIDMRDGSEAAYEMRRAQQEQSCQQ